jgi:hypothetical protein
VNITEEILKLIYQTEGTEELAESEKRVRSLRDRIKDLSDSYEQGNIKAAEYHRELKNLRGELTTTVKDADATKKGFMGSADGVLQLAYAVDDLQYGLRGVANNIPMLLSSLGMGAGLAGVISMATTLVVVFGEKLIEHIGPEKAKEVAGGLSSIKDSLEKLESKTYKLGIDYKAIEEGKKFLAEFEAAIARAEAARKRMSEKEQTAGSMFAAAADRAPGGAEGVQDFLATSFRDSAMELDPERKKLVAQLRAAEERDKAGSNLTTRMGVGAARERLAAREQAIRQTARERGMALFGRAEGGDQDAIREVARVLDNQGAMGPNVVRDLLTATPEGQEALFEEMSQLGALQAHRQLNVPNPVANRRKATEENQRFADALRANAAAEEANFRAMERSFGPFGAMEKEGQAKDKAAEAARKEAMRLQREAAEPGVRTGAATIDEAFGEQIRAQMAMGNMQNPNERAMLLQRIMEEQRMRGIGGGQKAAEEAFARNLEMVRANQSVMGNAGAAMQAQLGAMEAMLQRTNMNAVQFERLKQRYMQLQMQARANGMGNFRPGL